MQNSLAAVYAFSALVLLALSGAGRFQSMSALPLLAGVSLALLGAVSLVHRLRRRGAQPSQSGRSG